MLATLQRHKLQVSCESRTTPASTAHVFDATWITKVAPQPRHFGLSLTSGPGTRWRHGSGQGNKLGQYYAWNRTNDTLTGRWTTPDPAATPWWNLLDYLRNSPLTHSDPNGLNPIGGTYASPDDKSSPVTLDGVLAQFTMKWNLSGKETANGWIVQHVYWFIDWDKCDGTPGQHDKNEFWEAWQVENGKVIGTEDIANDHGDLDTFGTFSGWTPSGRGQWIITGKAQFIDDPEYIKKHDFVVPGKEEKDGPKGVDTSGRIPSTAKRPDGWKDGVDAFDHTLYISWDYCCENHWLQIVSTIDGQESRHISSDGALHNLNSSND